jgi:hypothetical protein
MPLFFIPQNARFSTFLSLHHTIHHLENIYIFYWHLFNLVAKILFLEKNTGGAFAPLHPPSYA